MPKKKAPQPSPFALPALLAVVVLFLLLVRFVVGLLFGASSSAGPKAEVTPRPTSSAKPEQGVEVVTPEPEGTPAASALPQVSAPVVFVPTPTPAPVDTPRPAGSITVPETVSRALFGDCGKNADGSVSPSWYPGQTSRDPDTGVVTYKWDRWQSTLDLIAQYGAIYRKNADQQVAYLTFDCGYEKGYTAKILDTLKEKNVQAVFFCAGDFFDDPRSTDLIRRMADEGHIIGNHTLHHPTMVNKSDEDFAAELSAIQDKVDAVLGYHYPMAFYRPPEGATNERDLYLARELGYTTVLWSFAYYDYNPQDQMAVDTALSLAESRLHPGCVYLLHAVSSTNTEMLGDLIDFIRGAGYELRRIDQ